MDKFIWLAIHGRVTMINLSQVITITFFGEGDGGVARAEIVTAVGMQAAGAVTRIVPHTITVPKDQIADLHAELARVGVMGKDAPAKPTAY